MAGPTLKHVPAESPPSHAQAIMVVGVGNPTTKEIVVKCTTDVSQPIQYLRVTLKFGASAFIDEQKMALKHWLELRLVGDEVGASLSRQLWLESRSREGSWQQQEHRDM